MKGRFLLPLASLAVGMAAGPLAAQPHPLDLADFQVNTYTTSYQTYTAVASDAAGNFVVVWESFGSAGGDTSNESVQARRYAADGTALDAENLQVNTYGTNFQGEPAVAMDADGNFAVVWTSSVSGSDDTSGWSIQGRRFAANGTALDPLLCQATTKLPAASLATVGDHW